MKIKTKIFIIIICLIFIILVISTINWFLILQKAHSTFEDYYKFRGCTELINRTDDYGFCKINSGEIIKIIKYKNKWYLDGDLPGSDLF